MNVIDKVLEFSGLNAKAFSEKIGVGRPQAIYDLHKGKTKSITPVMADKIISVFSDINKSWLLTGEGSMLKNDNITVKQPSEIERLLSIIESQQEIIKNLTCYLGIQTIDTANISLSPDRIMR
jgi:plasmid maintenance system antidote protein VapI